MQVPFLKRPVLFWLSLLIPSGLLACGDDAGNKSPMLLTDAPATVPVKVKPQVIEEMKQVLDRTSKSSIRLSITGVVPPKGPAAKKIYGLRVFVNKPDADDQTSDEDIHYAGAVAFAPGDPEPQGFLLDIKKVLSGLKARGDLALDRPLDITVVPDVAPAAVLPKEFRIPVDDVQISVHQRE